MSKQDLSKSSADTQLPASSLIKMKAHCTCRSYHNHPSMSGKDDDDPKRVVLQMKEKFKDFCSQHSFGIRCPAGSERRYIIRNSVPTKLREGDNPEFEVRCKKLVEYCIRKENLQRISAGGLTMEELVNTANMQREKNKRLPSAEEVGSSASTREDHGDDWCAGYYSIPGVVLVTGEYANDWHAAYTSVLRIAGAMVGQKEFTTTANDLKCFRDECSGCGLPRKIEQERENLSFELPLLVGKKEVQIQTTDSSDFDCAFCLASFSVKEDLFEHHADYHPDSFFHGLEKKACGNCDEVFYDKEWLDEHCWLVHGYSAATLPLWY